MTLGVAFSGDLFTPAPWTSLTPQAAANARQRGCDFCTIAVWYGADLSKLVPLIKMAETAGLAVVVVLHLDGLASETDRLMWFLNFGLYEVWFRLVCQTILGTGVYVELWNEAAYTGAQATTYGLSWGSLTALYQNAGTLASIARGFGLQVIAPLPLDQSPEQTSALIGAGIFPYDLIGAMQPAFVSGHLYPAEKAMSTRLPVIAGAASDCGALLILTETNPKAVDWKLPAWERGLSGVGHAYWEYLTQPPDITNFSSDAFQASLGKASQGTAL